MHGAGGKEAAGTANKQSNQQEYLGAVTSLACLRLPSLCACHVADHQYLSYCGT